MLSSVYKHARSLTRGEEGEGGEMGKWVIWAEDKATGTIPKSFTDSLDALVTNGDEPK